MMRFSLVQRGKLHRFYSSAPQQVSPAPQQVSPAPQQQVSPAPQQVSPAPQQQVSPAPQQVSSAPQQQVSSAPQQVSSAPQQVITIPSAFESLSPEMRVQPPPAPVPRFAFPWDVQPLTYKLTTCADPKIDVRIAACSNTNIAIGLRYQRESPVPNLKLHGIRACRLYNNYFQSLNFQEKNWNIPDNQEEVIATVKELVNNEFLGARNPKFDVEHLKAIWYPLGKTMPLLDFYAAQYIKHAHHTDSVGIDDFFYTAAQLCLPILSFDNRTDLRIFLYECGFETNKYHKVSHLIDALGAYFGVYAMPVFTLVGDHVCFREASLIHNLGDKRRIDHPQARILKNKMDSLTNSNEFLMRRI